MKKILLPLLLILVIAILLWPVDKKPDFNGDWKIEHLTIGNKALVKEYGAVAKKDPDSITRLGIFSESSLTISQNSFSMDIFGHDPIVGSITFREKYKCVVNSGSDKLLDSEYRISIDTFDSESPDYLDVMVTLSSVGKSIKIIMHKQELHRNKWLRDNFNSDNFHRRRGRP